MARPYKYTPEQLQKKIDEYFDWAENNPLYKYDVVKTGVDAGKELKIKIARPYTVQALVWFLNIDSQTWYNLTSEDQKNEALFEIATRANNRIKQNQMDGASAGLYQPMIIARLNGLSEKTDGTIATMDTTGKTSEEIKAAIQAIEAAKKG